MQEKSVELFSAFLALGWVITLSMNPSFFIQSSYLRRIEVMQQSRLLMACFVVLAIVQVSAILLTRSDTSDARESEPVDSPHRSANHPGVYALRAAGFTIAGMVWLYATVIINLSLFLSEAKTISPYTWITLLIIGFSVQHAWSITVTFIRSRRYAQLVTA
ncbi:MAG: hypothetical protein EON58_19795 [Alphaproteobacteria bacterium]|nr:MAG: hypothetical protein EON58_19795 [Alphaproteobacteria bacterium]